VARKGYTRNAGNKFFQKLEGKRSLEKPRCKVKILKWILKTVWNNEG
jgi:hypothetical protein